MAQYNTILAQRYAKAVFTLANTQNVLDKIDNDFIQLRELLLLSPQLQKVIHAPIISCQNKQNIFEKILKKQGCCSLTKQFIAVLIKKGRIGALIQIIDAYVDLLREHRGEVVAEVIVASKLQKSRIDELTKILNKALGKKIILKIKEDKKILGGLVVKIGSKMLDGSISGKLTKLKVLSKNAIVNV